jgi:hypothetical protein
MVAFAIFLLAATMILGIYIGWRGREYVERQKRLEETIKEMNEIIKRRKLPYPTQAGLEDAIAIVIEVLDQHQAQKAFDDTRLNQLADRLRQVRSNPQGYDVNQPSKK